MPRRSRGYLVRLLTTLAAGSALTSTGLAILVQHHRRVAAGFVNFWGVSGGTGALRWVGSSGKSHQQDDSGSGLPHREALIVGTGIGLAVASYWRSAALRRLSRSAARSVRKSAVTLARNTQRAMTPTGAMLVTFLGHNGFGFARLTQDSNRQGRAVSLCEPPAGIGSPVAGREKEPLGASASLPGQATALADQEDDVPGPLPSKLRPRTLLPAAALRRRRTEPAMGRLWSCRPAPLDGTPSDPGSGRSAQSLPTPLCVPLAAQQPESSPEGASGRSGESSATPGTPHVRRAAAAVPAEKALIQIFDNIAQGGLSLGKSELEQAMMYVSGTYNLGFKLEDTDRFRSFLLRHGGADSTLHFSSGEDYDAAQRISRQQFVNGVTKIAGVLERISPQMPLDQVKVILMAAFDRFDLNNDGKLCAEEFITAMSSMGVEFGRDDLLVLFSFLSPDDCDDDCDEEEVIRQTTLSQAPDWLEKCLAVARSSTEHIAHRTGWNRLAQAAGPVLKAMEEPGTFAQKVERTFSAAFGSAARGAEGICNAGNFGVEVAGLMVASNYVSELVNESLQHGAVEGLDILNMAPFLLFLGMSTVSMAKELDQLVLKEMSADEALLYAQFFYSNGFSQAEFRTLMSCPSCHWRVAPPGEVLNNDKSSLKLIVKGSTRVVSPDGQGMRLPAGTSIGETLFLRGRSIWAREQVVAAEPVLYVAWEMEDLRRSLEHNKNAAMHMSSMLASTMALNHRAVRKVQKRSKSVGAGHMGEVALGAASWLERCNSKGRSMRSPRSASRPRRLFWTRRRAGTPTSYHDIFEAMDQSDEGTIGKRDLCAFMAYIDHRLGLGTCEDSQERLYAYLGLSGSGEVGREAFAERMSALEASLRRVEEAGLSFRDMAATVRASCSQVDQNSDGFISLDEFQAFFKRLHISLDDEELCLLFRFFSLGDNQIDLSKLRTDKDTDLRVISALRSAVHSQVEKTGLPRFTYHAQKLHEVLSGPGDLLLKSRNALTTAWDGMDSFFEFCSCSTDVLGTVTAFYALWQEVTGINTLAEVDAMNLAPFVIFLGVSGMKALQHMAEGQECDLSEQEALLYAQAFKDHNFTIAEFRHFLRIGGAQWRTLRPGEALSPASGRALRVVVRGQECCGLASGKDFFDRLGEDAHAVDAHGTPATSVPTETTTLVTLDRQALYAGLEHEEDLKIKVKCAAAFSMADRLLEEYDSKAAALGPGQSVHWPRQLELQSPGPR